MQASARPVKTTVLIKIESDLYSVCVCARVWVCVWVWLMSDKRSWNLPRVDSLSGCRTTFNTASFYTSLCLHLKRKTTVGPLLKVSKSLSLWCPLPQWLVRSLLPTFASILSGRHSIVHKSQSGYQMSGKHLDLALPVCCKSEWMSQHFWRVPVCADGKRGCRAGQSARQLPMVLFLFRGNPKIANSWFLPLRGSLHSDDICCNPLITSATTVHLKSLSFTN